MSFGIWFVSRALLTDFWVLVGFVFVDWAFANLVLVVLLQSLACYAPPFLFLLRRMMEEVRSVAATKVPKAVKNQVLGGEGFTVTGTWITS